MMTPREPEDIEPNSEQRDEGQAQDVASDALDIEHIAVEDSERGGPSNPASLIPEDVPDLVEKMNEMVTSGRLDFDAFAGEPIHDDEEGSFGSTELDDDDE